MSAANHQVQQKMSFGASRAQKFGIQSDNFCDFVWMNFFNFRYCQLHTWLLQLETHMVREGKFGSFLCTQIIVKRESRINAMCKK